MTHKKKLLAVLNWRTVGAVATFAFFFAYLASVFLQYRIVHALENDGVFVQYDHQIVYHDDDWTSFILDPEARVFGSEVFDKWFGPNWVSSPQAIFLRQQPLKPETISQIHWLGSPKYIGVYWQQTPEELEALRNEFPTCHVMNLYSTFVPNTADLQQKEMDLRSVH